jgi:hypothetical protein
LAKIAGNCDPTLTIVCRSQKRCLQKKLQFQFQDHIIGKKETKIVVSDPSKGLLVFSENKELLPGGFRSHDPELFRRFF